MALPFFMDGRGMFEMVLNGAFILSSRLFNPSIKLVVSSSVQAILASAHDAHVLCGMLNPPCGIL